MRVRSVGKCLGSKSEMRTDCTRVNCRELLDVVPPICPGRTLPRTICSQASVLNSYGGRFRDYNRVGESLRNSPSPPVMVLASY